MTNTEKCNDCPFRSDPEMLIEPHYLKNNSYTTVKIISRCLANEYKHIIGSVVAEVDCIHKEAKHDND